MASQPSPGSVDAPELAELECRMASQPSPGSVLLATVPQALETDPGSPPGRGWLRVLAGAAVMALLGFVTFSLPQIGHAGAARALSALSRLISPPDEFASTVSQRTPPTHDAAPTAPLEPASPIVGESRASAPPAAQDTPRVAAIDTPVAKEITRQNATSKQDNERTARTPPTPAARFEKPSSGLSDTVTPDPGLAQVSREERVLPQPPSTRSPSGLSVEEGRPPVEAVALAMTNGSPSATATTGGDAGVVSGSASARAPDVPVPTSHTRSAAESRYEESLLIRTVLLRYENAYNRLDAKAATSVWPGADQSALTRAFNGLLSQKVSLGLCDITVIANIGGASCAGKARWEPKVGGGMQTADRYWDFQLRKTTDGWKIEEVRVR
jgi:hypothetical protein